MGSRATIAGLPMWVARKVMEEFIEVKPGEQVLIACDTEGDMDMANAFVATAASMGAEPTLLMMAPSCEELDKVPTAVFYKALEAADVYIPLVTTRQRMIHSVQVSKLKWEKKFRQFNLLGLWYNGAKLDRIAEILRSQDYKRIRAVSEAIANILDKGETIRVTSRQGSDFTASIKGIEYRSVNHYCTEPGVTANIEGSEAAGGPVEGTTEGLIVIDGPVHHVCEKAPGLREPIKLTASKGRVVKIEGGAEADRLRSIVEANENADNIAEVSLGTNPYIKCTGDLWNDKKVLGAMHVALGENIYQIYPYGTIDCELHMDCVLTSPSCWVDGQEVLRDGKLVLPV
ncbi:MAG: aminopeptidase [Chloroflexi bacterium]|nr:aminopeptidase [Chloroflexota bacterium]